MRTSRRRRCARHGKRSASTPPPRRSCGALAPVHTFVSGILVTPFVAMLEELPPLTVSDAEIARVLTVPILELLRTEEERELHRDGRADVARVVVRGRGRGRVGSDGLDAPRAPGDRAEGGAVADADGMTPEDRELRLLLGEAKTIAVVGLSHGRIGRRSRWRSTSSSMGIASCR